MKKSFWIGLIICLLPAVSWAQECETNDDCGENEVCVEEACPPCAEGDECPPCTSSCQVLGDGPIAVGPETCEADEECPVGMACQEITVPCSGGMVPKPVEDCACPDCAPGEDCPPCDCGEGDPEEPVQEEPGEEEPCEDEVIQICAPVECEPEASECGENFSCQPVEEICSGSASSSGSGGSAPSEGEATDPSNGDEDSAGSDETDEVTTEEEPTEEEPTEEEPTEDEVVVEEVEEDWECEVVASACLPNEIECATDEDCPADWSCELGFGGTVSIGGGCACPECPPGEDCPPCDCDEEEEVVEEIVETSGMCQPEGWEQYGWGGMDMLPGDRESGEAATSGPAEEGEEEEESGELSAEEAGGEEEPTGEGDEAAAEGDEAAAEGDEAAAEGDEAAAEGDEAAAEGDEAPAAEEAAAGSDDDGGCSTSGTQAPFAWSLLLMSVALVGLRRRTDLN